MADITNFPIQTKTISDIDTGSVLPTDQLFVFQSGVQKKVTAQNIADLATTGSTSLSGLSDTYIDSPSIGQVLTYSGSQWINSDTFDGDYNSLSNLPDLSLKANTSDLATVATTGGYSDLSGLPTLGTASTQDTGTGAGQIPVLDSYGLIDATLIPISFINKVTIGLAADRTTVADQNLGDSYKQSDTGKVYMLQALPSSVDYNWTQIVGNSLDWTAIIDKPSFTSTRILYGNGSTDAATSSNLIYDSGSLYIKNGGYLVGDADANTVDISYGRIRINGGTKVTGDAGASFKIKETWNDATMVGYNFVTTIVDTASDANSFVQIVNVNSIPVYQVRKDGAIALGVNSATAWRNGVGAMQAMATPSTAPSTAAFTDSAIRWYDDASKRYKYIDDTATVRTIAATSDINTGTVTSVAVSGGTTGLTVSGSPITSSGTITLSGTLAIANGGTGATTANDSFNALAPSQSSNSGKYLTTDGTNTSWATVSGGSSPTAVGGQINMNADLSSTTAASTYADIAFNNATQKDATQLFISRWSSEGVDIYSVLSGISIGDYITLTDLTVSSHGNAHLLNYQVSSKSGNHTSTYFTIGVSISSYTSNSPFVDNQAIRLTVNSAYGTIQVNRGGTGATNANTGLNNLLPAQTGNSGKYLTTDGSNTQWTTKPITVVNLASNATANTTTTLASITGLETTVGTGTYSFKYLIRYQSAATTTGVKFGVDHTGTTTVFLAQHSYAATGTLNSTGAAAMNATGATGNIYEVQGSRTKNAVIGAPTISVDTANADMLSIVQGLIIVTVSGTLKLLHASQVAASTQVMAGTSLILTKLA